MVVLGRLFPTRAKRDPYRHRRGPVFHDPRFDRMVHLVAPDAWAAAGAVSQLLVTEVDTAVALVLHDPHARLTALAHVATPHGMSDAPHPALAAFAAMVHADVVVCLFGAASTTAPATERNDETAALRAVWSWLDAHRLAPAVNECGGPLPIRVHVYPESGRVETLPLRRATDLDRFGRQRLG